MSTGIFIAVTVSADLFHNVKVQVERTNQSKLEHVALIENALNPSATYFGLLWSVLSTPTGIMERYGLDSWNFRFLPVENAEEEAEVIAEEWIWVEKAEEEEEVEFWVAFYQWLSDERESMWVDSLGE